MSEFFQGLAARRRHEAFAGSLAGATPWVRTTERAAAERYEVQTSYVRFDQRFNMMRQGLWNPRWAHLPKMRAENQARLVRAGKQGYSQLDWAFYSAATAIGRVTGMDINVPNRGSNGWGSLGARPLEGAKRWSGDPAANARAIRQVARMFGAGDVGITLLDRRWVYSHWFDPETRQSYPIRFSDEPGYEGIAEPTQLEDRTQVIPASMKYAVVMILPMDRRGVGTAPTLTQQATTQVTYSAIDRLILSVAEFIRGLGYNAIPSANCTALNIPLAIDAGLGELGRNAKLIHPLWGPMCRICKVITDLPLTTDSPIETGATTFCETCGKCARACPSRAIPQGPRSHQPVGEFNSAGVKMWQVDHGACAEYWAKVGTNCGLCLVACPFNKSAHWSHAVAKFAIARMPAINPLMVSVDDLLGYGEPDPRGFWVLGNP